MIRCAEILNIHINTVILRYFSLTQQDRTLYFSSVKLHNTTDLDVTRGALKYALMKSTFSVRPMNCRRLTRDTSGMIIS